MVLIRTPTCTDGSPNKRNWLIFGSCTQSAATLQPLKERAKAAYCAQDACRFITACDSICS
eukprot:scaffold10617_cov18-Tisochrysis_lutea.AAC.5